MPLSKLNVIVVGGSLAGLMQGIVIKRLGHNVTILEEHVSPSRNDYGTGVAMMKHVWEFLAEYDKLETTPMTVDCSQLRVVDKDYNTQYASTCDMLASNWQALYQRLRANFDDFRDEFSSIATPRDGKATYEVGKSVKGLEYASGRLVLQLEDVTWGSPLRKHREADLVIAADGPMSRMRQLLQPSRDFDHAGFVTWRGTVTGRDLSPKTKKLLQHETLVHRMEDSYIAVLIPAKDNSVTCEEFLAAWVWYTYAEESDLANIMTDDEGHRQHSPVPTSIIRTEVWEKRCDEARRILPEMFAELVHRTRQPFVSPVMDIGVTQPSFFNGQLLFVGDALAPFRPYLTYSMSTDQAAFDALMVPELLRGAIDLSTWENRVVVYAERTRSQSIALGSIFGGQLPVTLHAHAELLLHKSILCLKRVWHELAVLWHSIDAMAGMGPVPSTT